VVLVQLGAAIASDHTHTHTHTTSQAHTKREARYVEWVGVAEEEEEGAYVADLPPHTNMDRSCTTAV
jgi:hypothetical protein